ncbi:hypothetical protein ABW21_db0206056 [Orbilia brochopaga]|nr:hypothetical protein ABW21_db0206056 [Drechslerella brochopaga]
MAELKQVSGGTPSLALEFNPSTKNGLTHEKLSELDAYYEEQYKHESEPEFTCSISHGRFTAARRVCGITAGCFMESGLPKDIVAQHNPTERDAAATEYNTTAKQHYHTSFTTYRYISSKGEEEFWTPYSYKHSDRVQKGKFFYRFRPRYPTELILSDSE